MISAAVCASGLTYHLGLFGCHIPVALADSLTYFWGRGGVAISCFPLSSLRLKERVERYLECTNLI